MPKKPYLLFAVLLTGTACGPIQGYPGPELPSNQVAIVYRESKSDTPEQMERFTADSQPFETNGISLLPGEHDFDTFFESYGERRDCRPEYKVDEWGYRSCLENEYRSRRSRRNRIWVSCSISQYTTVIYHCLVKITESDCHFKAILEAGEKYDIVIGDPPVEGRKDPATLRPSGVFSRKTKRQIGTSECNVLRTHEDRRTFSSPH